MSRFIFNQEVKHHPNIYSEGDVVTLPDETAEYFASNGWGYIEGQDKYEGEPILNPYMKPGPSLDIVDTVLDVHSTTIGLEDTNNG